MTTLAKSHAPPDKTGLADPNWCSKRDGWPKTNALKAMRDHGGGEKLMRELRGKRIKKKGLMALSVRRVYKDNDENIS